ncbi:hypothetical protein ACROYT_G015685 [Oculina patagonica]
MFMKFMQGNWRNCVFWSYRMSKFEVAFSLVWRGIGARLHVYEIPKGFQCCFSFTFGYNGLPPSEDDGGSSNGGLPGPGSGSNNGGSPGIGSCQQQENSDGSQKYKP